MHLKTESLPFWGFFYIFSKKPKLSFRFDIPEYERGNFTALRFYLKKSKKESIYYGNFF